MWIAWFATNACPVETGAHDVRAPRRGAAGLAKTQAEGRNWIDSEQSRRKLGQSNAKRQRERIEWELTHEKPY